MFLFLIDDYFGFGLKEKGCLLENNLVMFIYMNMVFKKRLEIKKFGGVFVIFFLG